ncbi:MAG TPA: hypothetical protein VED66_05635 [Candidatus Sulfotelmatobacter sp.]|nr:hypothetical protein [Candidatus Sulfotelmatobacter sp.]
MAPVKSKPPTVEHICAEHQIPNWYFRDDPLGRKTHSEMREGCHGSLGFFCLAEFRFWNGKRQHCIPISPVREIVNDFSSE